jgi:hypothetical protein
MVIEHGRSLVEATSMPGILERELLKVEMMAELVRLCCAQHNAIYVAQRFMWRSRRDTGRNGRLAAPERHISFC